jgi:DNA-binding NtrC family response regulator
MANEPAGDLTVRQVDADSGGESRLWLVVVGDDDFAAYPLPQRGSVRIGRHAQCEIHIADENISRYHAQLTIAADVSIEDLGSQNGTWVRERQLGPGEAAVVGLDDVIRLGPISVLIQRRAGPARPRLWNRDYFERRVADECGRAGARFALAHALFVRAPPDVVLHEALAGALRPVDVVGRYGAGEYELMLPDMGRREAATVAARLASALVDRGLAPRIGVAVLGEDGSSPAELSARARQAAHGNDDRSDAADLRSPVLAEPSMQELYALATRIAAGDLSVLILGETGAGKEVLAEAIHARSPRAGRPLVGLSCAALTETLLESELFGHERGAFTGATQTKPGLIETAAGGTLFLDEIGEMPLGMQAKLLRVLEEKKVTPVGGVKPRAVDVRVLSASNRDLAREIAAGRFRADLFYRLSGATLTVPPLRERRREIAPLADRFIRAMGARSGRSPNPRLSPEVLQVLEASAWPGNIRELRNVVERALLLCPGELIELAHLPPELEGARAAAPAPAPAVEAEPHDGGDDERERIRIALERAAGNQTTAARMLGISLRTMVNRMNKFGFPRPRKGQKPPGEP